MSRHGEAKLAMDALNRKEINGHVIDVSWAVVQRSEGFLDGGDRTTMLANQSPSPSPAQFELGCTNTAVSLPHTPITVTPPAEAHPSRYSVQTASLLVKNLPAVLFSQPADLHPLFGPFGEVKRLDILPSGSAGVLQNNISVVVEYATMTQAMEALQVLHGQAYSSDPVTAEFLQPIAPEGDAAVLMSPGDDMKAGLNPLATPFIIPAGFPPNTLLAPLASIYPEAKVHRTDLTAASNGLLAVNPQHLTPYATPSSLMYLPVTGTTRPNSAPSDWAGQPYHLVPGRRPILLDTLQLRFHSITSTLYTRFRHGFIERYRA
ncbi:hypothetical protein A0H81_12592 [Grifola frondosa]|uniref:RRM domain-containing protein n=1 Tax=Grifola frondosa TaxID=5627 RepID=A0A1C7LS43_GRIFR|nr:hypothetical protein A0H81_12592 [Grifola frondosa]